MILNVTLLYFDFSKISGAIPQEYFLLACQKLSLSPKRVLVFEDSNVSIEASLAAGCQTIAIPDLVELAPRLLTRCHHTLASFDEAYAILT